MLATTQPLVVTTRKPLNLMSHQGKPSKRERNGSYGGGRRRSNNGIVLPLPHKPKMAWRCTFFIGVEGAGMEGKDEIFSSETHVGSLPT